MTPLRWVLFWVVGVELRKGWESYSIFRSISKTVIVSGCWQETWDWGQRLRTLLLRAQQATWATSLLVSVSDTPQFPQDNSGGPTWMPPHVLDCLPCWVALQERSTVLGESISFREDKLFFVWGELLPLPSQVAVAIWSAKLCLTTCDSLDYSPPGSSVHGILQERIL